MLWPQHYQCHTPKILMLGSVVGAMSRARRNARTAAAYRREALAALFLMMPMRTWFDVSLARCVCAHRVST